SRSLMNYVIDPIRVAIVSPEKDSKSVANLIGELEARHNPLERKQYLPEFPGFSRVFGVRALEAAKGTHVSLPDQFETEVFAAKKPHIALAEGLAKALSVLEARRSEFDVIFLYLPQR